MSEGKRRSERRPMFRVCRYNIQGREYADLSTNISTGGIFIKTFSPPAVGTAVILTVKLPDEWGNLPMQLVGRVVHINNDSNPHKRGMGIEFTSVIADSLPIIEYFVREVYQEGLNRASLEEAPSSLEDVQKGYQYHIIKKNRDGP